MADFIDSEAEESEDEELDIKDKKKLKRLKQLEDDDDDEEEEDDEEKIREELRDLIDDGPLDDEEESGGSSSSEGEGEGSDRGIGEKRKKSDEEEFDDRLEDEDYDLLEENLGRKIERRKRFKRLRRIEDEESDGEGGEGEGEEREAIANELFEGSDNEEDIGSVRQSIQDRYEVEEGEEDYSDADDFIVDDEGRPIAEKRKKRTFFSDSTLQEAQEIFGVDFDYDDFEKYAEDEYEDDEEEDEYIDDDDEGKRRKPKKAIAKKATKKSIFEIYEPSELKRGHFTDFDIKIRQTDIPERMQLRDIPITSVSEGSEELDEEADWIYRHAFCNPTLSSQEWSEMSDGRGRPKKDLKTIGKIKKALEFMRNQHFEVPFISFYRKEYVQPELSIHDLWRVYRFDAKWCQLHTRKTTLLNLMEKMKDYQQEQLTKDVNAPIPEHVRILSDEDIDRLKNVQSTEELRDIHNHFLLYYAQDVKSMQDALRAKRREAAKNKLKLTKINEDGEEVEEEDEENGEKEDEEKEDETQDLQVKKGSRSGSYALCIKAGLGGFAKRFGLKPEEFAKNLRDNYQRHDVEQEGGTPIEIAKEYISPKFPTPEDVIRGAKFVVATQLSREPLVRSSLRDIFQDRARINVRPTKKGQKEVDENHPCYSMKYLKDKPVKDLKNDQYLKLYLAHEDKLLTLSTSQEISGLTASSYIDEIKQLYYRDEFMHHVQEWNSLRSECVELAIKKMLLPELTKELHARLIEEAKESIAKACSRKLYNWIKVAPFSVDFGDDDDDEWDTSKGLRIMGLSYVPDLSQAAFCCMIAPDGECTDHLRLPHLLKRKNSFREEEKMLKEADLMSLKNFILTKKPHAIAVGGESRETLMIVADLKQIVSSLVMDEKFPQIPVEIVDNDFAKIYANSLKGESDFRDYPMLLRQAISVARRLQDPLVEFSQLCTPDDEILCLRYHPLQEQLPKEELLDIITIEFVNRVNEVGVDINEVVINNYCANLVQFVCGLGPRKGAMLVKLLKQTNQRLENRTQLVTSCHMGPKVFINCAGFIKIDTNALGDSTEAYVEVLDGSRVHPETYEWARKMAVDALEYDDEDPNPAGALEEILDKPEKLKDLDLDAFAEELERQSFGNKSITLYDIRSELSHRYKDLRVPYQSPGPELIFDILTKETPETFYVGKLVTATVIGISHKKPEKDQLDHANPVRNEESGLWQCPFCLKNDFPELSEVWNHFDAGGCVGQATGVRIRLDNGVSGYVHIKNLSDSRVTDPTQRVQRGQLVHSRITKIDVERFSVEATCKSSDLIDKNHEWRPAKDPYYDHEAEAKDLQAEEEMKKMKQRQTYIKRVIVHPAFHNISYGDAEKLMANMEQGEVIIRPSSKGSDHLTVTWKVADNIYQHIDVREEGKENAFSLGQSLWIGNEEFEDLDEIIARHVNPMASYVRDMFAFRYYKDTEGGLKDKAEEMLKEEKKKNPAKIHYIISVAKNYPGKFLLSYLPRARCKHEYVSVTSNGFRFRGQVFDSVNSLFRWFKEHFRDPLPCTPSTPRNQAANASVRTTFTTPAYTNPLPMTGMSAEAIHRVAQNIPTHLMHTLSQVASHTPHYAHTPAAFSTASSYFPNTPYTPSGQTPFMTPYATTPRYQGGMTPSAISMAPSPAQQSTSSGGGGGGAVFLHPGAVTPRQTPRYDGRSTPSYEARATPGYEPRNTPAYEPRGTPGYEGRSTPGYEPRSMSRAEGRSTPAYQRGGVAAEDWRRAAEEWARKQNRGPARGPPNNAYPADMNSPYTTSPRVPSWKGTPQPHHAHPYSDSPYDPGEVSPASIPSKFDPFEKSPRYPGTPRSAARSTPGTINSPHSMSLGDSTPLYDETV